MDKKITYFQAVFNIEEATGEIDIKLENEKKHLTFFSLSAEKYNAILNTLNTKQCSWNGKHIFTSDY